MGAGGRPRCARIGSAAGARGAAACRPYLDQRDRATLQVDVSLQRRIWKTVANPGVVVRNGEAVGTWTAKKKGAGLSVSLATWVACSEQKLRDLAEAYAAFRGLKLLGVSFE